MNSSELKQRTKRFGLMVINLVGLLPNTSAGRAIGNQLIRSGTAIGANYRAACRAKSTADFISKIDNVEEEADESCYWLELIMEGNILSNEVIQPIWSEADQLTAIFTKISKTSKTNSQKYIVKEEALEYRVGFS
ncbi:four helix bundle protein [Spirosoma foliorum]|uniref:Four helix bundle protein n=1 Tax=Spirosoma foliorum TaxID=2710596 RepID=A0A7G5GRY9_9BACT|nr:four helix bundle protein [Spirosoma foliorum]QMW01631.1 four helix bundle protein [Spirosoma foliorum]